jgi:hemerythrin-like domain-containing protein
MTTPSPDFFATLLAFHARIEEQVRALEKASDLIVAGGERAAALATVAGVLDFFRTAGALHQADEEQSLFPRLRPLPAFRMIVSALETQHKMSDDAQRELAELVPRFTPADGETLRRFAYRFAEMQRGHLIAEERALFPLATKALAPDVLAELGREQQTRAGAVVV